MKTATSPSLLRLASYGEDFHQSTWPELLWASETLVLVHTTTFVLCCPRCLECARSHQCSETGKIEANLLDGSWRSWDSGCASQFFLSSRRRWELGFIAHSFCAKPGIGAEVNACSLVQTATLLSVAFGGLVYTGPYQLSKLNEIEASSSGSTWKSWGIVYAVQLLWFSGGSWELGYIAIYSALRQRGAEWWVLAC